MLKKYYEKILDQFLLNADKSVPSVSVFRTDRSDALSRFLTDYCELNNRDLIVSSKLTDNFSFLYSPFLEIVKENYRLYGVRKLRSIMSGLDIFYNHRELISSYLIKGHAERREDILEDEIDFEKKVILETVLKMFFHSFSDKTTVLLIDNLYELPQSTVDILSYFADSPVFSGKVFICVLVDRDDNFRHNFAVGNFIKQAESKNLCVDIFFNEPKPFSCHREHRNADIKNKDGLRIIKDCYHFLAFSDALDAVKAVEANFYNNSDTDITPSEIFDFHITQGDVYTMLNNIDVAMIHYNTAADLAVTKNDKELIALSSLKLGSCAFKKSDYDTAVKYTEKTLTLSEETGNKHYILKSLFLFFMAEDRSRVLDMNKWMSVFRRLVSLAKELRMVNILIYCYTNPFGMYSNYTDEIRRYHKKGIKLAGKRNDTFRLARAYHTLGMAYAVQGDYSNVFKYYKISRHYNKLLDDVRGLSYIYNGMGFYFYLTGKYNESIDCYFKALKYIKRFNDYHEAAMTLFNIALSYFMGFEDKLALKFLDYMLIIMNAMNYKNLAYHSEFGIRSLYGVVAALNGDLVKAYQSFAVIKSNKLKPYPKKNEEFFMYEILLALLSKTEKNSRQSLFHFNKAQYYLNRKNDVITYFYPRYFFEKSSLFHQFNDSEQYNKTLEDGYNYSVENGNKLYEFIFKKKLGYNVSDLNIKMPVHGFDIIYWTQSAKLENNLIMLHRRISEINLLNRIQDYYVTARTPDDIIDKVIGVLNDSLSTENISYYRKDGNNWIEYYSNRSDKTLANDEIEALIINSPFKVINRRVNKLEKMAEFTSYIAAPLLVLSNNYGFFMFTSGNESLRELSGNDLKIIKIIMNQLSIAIERKIWEAEILSKNDELKEYNKKLFIAATTDKLTGLYNRQALYRRIQEEEERLLDSGEGNLAILFIDLDNFKYYNDKFGHDVGDKILIEISSIMKKAVRSNDFIARYGGDEFIIILPDVSPYKSEEAASRIIDNIRNKNGFTELIEEGEIDDYVKLSASIGISYYAKGDDVNSLVLKADKALYRAKNSGKNRLCVY